MTNIAAQHWVIVGAGALAQWIGCSLRQQQTSPKLSVLHRNPQLHNCRYRLLTADTEVIAELPTQASHAAHADVVVAAIKAYQVAALLEQLDNSSWCTSKTRLLLSFNGMHSEPLNSSKFADSLFLVTTSGLTRDHQGTHLRGLGQSWLGPVSAADTNPDSVFSTLSATIPPLQGVEDITRIRWQKLLVNCAINALTVVEDCVNGGLLAPQLQSTLQALLSEACAVAAEDGYHFELQQAVQQTRQVLAQTAANSSSMRQDVLAGRATEIDYLNGFIAKRARQLSIAAPVNEQLWQRVRRISYDHPQ